MKRDEIYLLDILEAAKLAISYVENVSKEEFMRNVQCQDSVIRRIEIIGEAARRVSEKTKVTRSDIPWSEMMGMRNLMIHDYDGVDLKIVWDTVQRDLPRLIELIEPLVPPDKTFD
jgi:uncharacterized protein with HEPN domain